MTQTALGALNKSPNKNHCFMQTKKEFKSIFPLICRKIIIIKEKGNNRHAHTH